MNAHRSARLAAGILLAVLAFVAPALAQTPSIVGVWSSTQYLTDGTAFASYFLQFDASGRLQERLIVRGGTSDYFGQYQYSPQTGMLQFVFTDYEPKMDCTFACIPIQPSIAIGTPFTVQVQFNSPNQLIWQDAGTPMVFVRQQ